MPVSNQCPAAGEITGNMPDFPDVRTAAATLHVDWYNLTRETLNRKTKSETGRVRNPNPLDAFVYSLRSEPFDAAAVNITTHLRRPQGQDLG